MVQKNSFPVVDCNQMSTNNLSNNSSIWKSVYLVEHVPKTNSGISAVTS